MKRLSTLLLMASCASAPSVAYAQRGPIFSAEVSVAGSVETNPFHQAGSTTVGAGTLRFDPRLLLVDERGQTSINGGFRYTRYSERYDSDESAVVGISSSRRLSERTSISGTANLNTTMSPYRDGFALDPALDPDLDPDLDFGDDTIRGSRVRRTALGANFSVSHALTPLSSIGANIGTNFSFFGNDDDDQNDDYRTVSGGLSYSRSVSPRASLNAGVQGSYVDYAGAGRGQTTIVSPTVGVGLQLSPTISTSADAGVSFLDLQLDDGTSRSSISFTASFQICNRGRNSNSLCFAAQRSQQPTARAGVTTVNAASLSYSVRLGRVDSFQLGARYSLTEQSDLQDFGFGDRDSYGASATYRREIGDRLSFSVTPSVSRTQFGEDQSYTNFSAMAAISLRVGSRQ